MTQPTPPPGEPGDTWGPLIPGPPPAGPAYPGPPPPGYPPPAYPAAPMQPAGAVPPPHTGDPHGPAKSRRTAGMLGIFLGAVGVHRFYLGYTSIGVLQILVTIATCGIGGFWGIIEGALTLSGRGIMTDADGRPLGP